MQRCARSAFNILRRRIRAREAYSLKEDIVGSSSRALEIMLGAVGLVLLLVCVNIANLLLVRGSERAQEFALRSALGADRSRLIRQMLIESAMLAVGGAIASLVVARLAMAGIVMLGAGRIPRLATLSLDPRLLAFSFAIATLSAIVFGLAPARRVARTQPGDVLRDQSRSSTGGIGQMRVREWLVISQVAMAFVLVVGAGLLLASFNRIQRVDLGVRTDGVLTFELNLPGARYDSTARASFYEDFASRAATLPGVRSVGGVSRLPATGPYHSWGVRALTGPLANTPRGQSEAQQRVISGDYLRTVGIPILKGRAFDTRDDFNAPQRAIVSKGFADRLYPGVDPIGQRLRTGGREAEIIGVVSEIAVDHEGRQAFFVYHPHSQFAGQRNWPLSQVVATTDSRAAVQPAIRRLLAARDPQLVMYKPLMLDEVIGGGAAPTRVYAENSLNIRRGGDRARGTRAVRRPVLRCSPSFPRVQHPYGPRRRAVGDSPYDSASWNDRDGSWAGHRTRCRDVTVEVDGVGALQGESVRSGRVRRRRGVHDARWRAGGLPAGPSRDFGRSEGGAAIMSS
jgi:predicted permease